MPPNTAPAPSAVQQTRSSRIAHGLLLAALALFLLQVLPLLSYRWVTDESWYAATGYSLAHGTGARNPSIGPNDIENHFDARPPGTALVAAGFFSTLGTSEITARLGSVLAGFFAVLLTYAIARRHFGDLPAALAALLLATDNFLVLTARTARPEALTTLCVLLALWLLQHYSRTNKPAYAFLTGLALAAGTMFHITLLGWIVSLFLLAVVIDRHRRAFPLRGALLLSAGYALGLLPFATWILTAPLGPTAFRAEYLKRAAGTPLTTKLALESHRYFDFLGLHAVHTGVLANLPLRLPIPLALLAFTIVLWRRNRTWFYVELALLLPTILWLLNTVNRSSRYLVLLAPIFALLTAAAYATTREQPKARRLVLAAAALIILMQFGANAVLLRAAKQANYEAFAAHLRRDIPTGAPAYGTITYWLALDDHPYISYERTTPLQAAQDFHVRYFILGDRTMSTGDYDPAFYHELRTQLATITAHSTLVDTFADPYYGDTKIYRLNP